MWPKQGEVEGIVLEDMGWPDLGYARSFGSVNREKVVLVRCVKWGAWGGGATDVEWTVGF